MAMACSGKAVLVLTIVLAAQIGALCSQDSSRLRKDDKASDGGFAAKDGFGADITSGRKLKIAIGVFRILGKAFIGVVKGITRRASVDFGDSGPDGTVSDVCTDGCCQGCGGDDNFRDIKEDEPLSINGCTQPSCFCDASGLLGVQPNPFDDTCGTFFNCPFPEPRDCAAGTLFNRDIGVCDFPDKVDCAAVGF